MWFSHGFNPLFQSKISKRGGAVRVEILREAGRGGVALEKKGLVWVGSNY
jgi:hypothetical protein